MGLQALQEAGSKAGKVASAAKGSPIRQVALGQGGKPSPCKNCSGCVRKKGCKKVAMWNKAQKQTGAVVANKARKVSRRSQSVSTNIGRVTPLERPERAVQRLEEESNKKTCNDRRVGFNKLANVNGKSSTLCEKVKSLGSERPVRSSARKEVGSYWEKPVREERLSCKYCKTSFSAASKLRRHMEIHGKEDHHTVV